MSVTKTNRIIFDGKLKAARDYWVDRLSREAATSGLLPDSVEPPRESGARRVVTLPLTETLSRRLVRSSGGSNISLYTTLLAALNVCLYRHTGRSRLVVASPSLRAEREVAGHAPNVLPVITDVDGAQTFNGLVANVGETLKEAYENQGYPFGRLLRDLGLDESGGGRALAEVSLRLRNIHDDLPEVGDGVSFVFDASADELTGAVEYDASRFPHDTVGRLASRFVNLLDAATERPNAPVRELEFLSDDERTQLVAGWNETATDFPAHECLHELFEAQAARSPDAVSLVFADQHITYRELNARADRLARQLRALGVGPEAVVAIHAGRGPEMIVGLLATLKAGGAYMPLDPDYPAQRLAFMLEDGRPAVVLTRQSLLDSLPECDAHVVSIDAPEPRADAPTDARHAHAATPDNLAYVIYTSGSTGRPKGVMIEHRSAVNLTCAQTEAFFIRADSRVLQFASFNFDASVSEIFTALCSGATLHLGTHATLHKGGDIIKTLREEEITTVTLPPALLAVSTGGDRLPSLETLVVAGEECPADLPARWAGGRRFINAYGPTETSVCATLFEHGGTNHLRVPIGGPIANVQVYVLDDDQQLVPVGVEGELYVGGDGVGRGYLDRPSLTASRFLPDPFSPQPGARLYRTGDFVRRLTDGSLEYVGRGDGQVKVRGHRVELGEVESALLRAPGVRAAVVVARDGAGGGAMLVAYVVAGDGWEGAEGVRREAALRLPEYMRPSEVVELAELPLTENGKVDRGRLPEVAAEARRGGGECASETERVVAGVWGEVLGVEGVGGGDNFFELGGHSLLATQVMARVREEFGVDLPVYDLFENPTVEDFAAHIEAARNGLHGAADSSDSWGDVEEGEL